MASASKDAGLLRIVLVALAIVVLAPLLFVGGGMMGGGMMGGGMMGGGGGTSIVSVLLSLVWLVVLVGAGVLAYRWLARGGTLGTGSALEELRLAYARGEITGEEFEERRAVLEAE